MRGWSGGGAGPAWPCPVSRGGRGLTWNRRRPFRWRKATAAVQTRPRAAAANHRAVRQAGRSRSQSRSRASPRGGAAANRTAQRQVEGGAHRREGGAAPWAGLRAVLNQSRAGASVEGRGEGRAAANRSAVRRGRGRGGGGGGAQHGGPGALRRFPGGFPAALREPARLGSATRGEPGIAGTRPGGAGGASQGGGARPGRG